MRYRFSAHAQEALEERGLTEEEVDAVLQSPEQIVSSKKGRKIYQTRGTFANGHTLPCASRRHRNDASAHRSDSLPDDTRSEILAE